ncbi:hypothetical protein [Gandjariella thermophila]|uniref:Uncharacterized protein n=1 Tax=Gandjariella thermophila TaxID=1931992 RepID=A0A4D4J7A3_9PSEU|nr:hypothetical protein [Gandjariella thermophila]GDY29753.1 hypothetical protein GTS_13860 [Gandjariella thermophila]
MAVQPEAVQELLSEVRRLRGRFATTAPRAWDAATAGAELAVQLGHLALCLLRQRGTDVSDLEDPDRPISDIGDELADVVLAGLSASVLAGSEPAPEQRAETSQGDQIEAFLRLLVTAGWVAEAGLVSQGYRHRPTGSPPSVAEAGSAMLTACEAFARRLGLDLRAEFRAMAADADEFLDSRSDAP